jgi:HK97 gp10 family phage protein
MTTVNLGKGATYTLDTRELDRILKGMPSKRDEIVAKAAFEIEANAKKLAPVDTGALKNSIFTKTKKRSGYRGAAADAQDKNPEVKNLPESEFEPGDNEAVVGSSVEYAFWVEMGHHKVSARPFLGTAYEMVKAKFDKMLKELVK